MLRQVVEARSAVRAWSMFVHGVLRRRQRPPAATLHNRLPGKCAPLCCEHYNTIPAGNAKKRESKKWTRYLFVTSVWRWRCLENLTRCAIWCCYVASTSDVRSSCSCHYVRSTTWQYCNFIKIQHVPYCHVLLFISLSVLRFQELFS